MDRLRRLSFLLLLLPVLVYLPSLFSDYLYDDYRFIAENQAITSLANLPRFFSDPSTICPEGGWEGIYRPLRTLSFALDFFFFARDPSGYHLQSILLHGLNVILAYAFIFHLFRSRPLALGSALLFGLHPVHVESVAWLSSRDSLLCLLFILLSLLALLNSGKKKWLALPGLFFFLLAALSRETALILPAILVGCEFLPFLRTHAGRRRWPLWIYPPLFALGLLYVILRFSVLGENFLQRGLWGGGLLPHLQSVSRGFLTNFLWLIYPGGFHFDHQVPLPSRFPEPFALIGLFLAAALLFLLILFRIKKSLPFSILWFFLALLPTSNLFFALNILVADRFLYIPSIGLCLLFAPIWLLLGRRVKKRLLLIFPALFVLGALSFFTVRNAMYFKSPESLWKAVLDRSPGNFRAQHGLAVARLRSGDFESAEMHLQTAVAINPGYSLGHRDLGRLYLILASRGNSPALKQKGMYHLKKALTLMEEEPFHENQKDYRALREMFGGEGKKE